MKVVLLTKAAVPNVTAVRIDPKTGTLVREGVPLMINPWDRDAAEFALRLRDRHGGTVIALSMAPPAGKDALESLMGMGVDEAILVSDRVYAGADTLATAYTLAKAIEKFAPDFDVVVAGEETTDSTTAHVGAQVASWLGIPYIYYAIDAEVNGRSLLVRRYLEDEGLIETYEIDMPVLVSVQKGSQVPRDISLLRKLKAKGRVKTFSNSDLGLPAECVGLRGSPTIVAKVFEAKLPQRKGELFEGPPDEAARWLASKLREVGVI